MIHLHQINVKISFFVWKFVFFHSGTNPTAPSTVEDLVLPSMKTATGEEFIFFDSGQSKSRIIMFVTETSLNFLDKCDVIHMDGTISSGPQLFAQVYVIHGEVCKCFKKKTKINCTTLFNRINSNDWFNPFKTEIFLFGFFGSFFSHRITQWMESTVRFRSDNRQEN